MTKDNAKKTLTGLIRSRVAIYEARQLDGVSQKTFAEELTEEGREVSYRTFRVLYARARKQISQTQNSPPRKETTKQQVQIKKETAKEEVSIQETHKPTDLDEIAKSEPNLKMYSRYARGKK